MKTKQITSGALGLDIFFPLRINGHGLLFLEFTG
jgi:hypothetical protein